MSPIDPAILTSLVCALEQIPGMEEPDVRRGLVSIGFSQSERSRVKITDDMHTDLLNMVAYIADLQKLGVLIENAKSQPKSQETQNELNEILIRLKSEERQNIEEHRQSSRSVDESVHQPNADSVEFDVFLAHNSQDKPAVKVIGELLKKEGLRPWLDEWEFRPGFPWLRELEKQIKNVKSAAVFVGPNGIGPWQDREVDALLLQFVRRECPVIPVILPGCEQPPELPLFLEGMTWVDFRKDDPPPLQRLIWGITGKKPY